MWSFYKPQNRVFTSSDTKGAVTAAPFFRLGHSKPKRAMLSATRASQSSQHQQTLKDNVNCPLIDGAFGLGPVQPAPQYSGALLC
jgi:hypothetical protein